MIFEIDPNMRIDFLKSVRRRCSEMGIEHRRNNYGQVAHIAHQVSGAGGLYGYEEITTLGSALETGCLQEPQSVQHTLMKLEQVVACELSSLEAPSSIPHKSVPN